MSENYSNQALSSIITSVDTYRQYGCSVPADVTIWASYTQHVVEQYMHCGKCPVFPVLPGLPVPQAVYSSDCGKDLSLKQKYVPHLVLCEKTFLLSLLMSNRGNKTVLYLRWLVNDFLPGWHEFSPRQNDTGTGFLQV